MGDCLQQTIAIARSVVAAIYFLLDGVATAVGGVQRLLGKRAPITIVAELLPAQQRYAVLIKDFDVRRQAWISAVAIHVLRLTALRVKAVIQGICRGAARVVVEIGQIAKRIDDLVQLFTITAPSHLSTVAVGVRLAAGTILEIDGLNIEIPRRITRTSVDAVREQMRGRFAGGCLDGEILAAGLEVPIGREQWITIGRCTDLLSKPGQVGFASEMETVST